MSIVLELEVLLESQGKVPELFQTDSFFLGFQIMETQIREFTQDVVFLQWLAERTIHGIENGNLSYLIGVEYLYQ